MNGQHPSHGIRAPTALAESEVHHTRVCLARYVPPPGFPTLLGVFSSRNLPVLFHTGNAPGVPPPGLFPPADTELFRASLPSWRCPAGGQAGEPSPGFCSPRKSVLRRMNVSPLDEPMPSWISRSPLGFSPSLRWDLLRVPSSPALEHQPLAGGPAAGRPSGLQSIAPQGDWLALAGYRPLWGSSATIHSSVFEK